MSEQRAASSWDYACAKCWGIVNSTRPHPADIPCPHCGELHPDWRLERERHG